jgi:hypothetical protein
VAYVRNQNQHHAEKTTNGRLSRRLDRARPSRGCVNPPHRTSQ